MRNLVKRLRCGAPTKLNDCVQRSDASKSIRKNLADEQNERLSEFLQEDLRFANLNAQFPQHMRLLTVSSSLHSFTERK